jgi:predicted ATP-dependent endonuclease of OLD family
MQISSVSIENFRSIKNVEVSLDPFNCIIGHNNAGKSTLLMSLTLFRSGSAIKVTDFYNSSKEVSITVVFDRVTTEILRELAPEHVPRIQEIVFNNKLTLVRRYGLDGRSTLNCLRLVPKNSARNPENLKTALGGKKGKEIGELLETAFPERSVEISDAKLSTQKAALALADSFLQELAPEEFELQESALPTGISASIVPLLPEILYIPAVKDLTDELKTKEASSFGKIIRVLLDLVNETDELRTVQDTFKQLDGMLNRTTGTDGIVSDGRLQDVRRIESCVEDFIKEQFKSVSVEIEIPPPDLKTIFANAKIFLHDGVKTDVDAKGDGLKRAVLFSLLRTLVTIQEEKNSRNVSAPITPSRYLFLFEEPELYLHPSSQRVLYDALRDISQTHQVCVCTHSPYFFSAADSGSFIRLKKTDSGNESPPCCNSLSINLSSNVAFKDAFQIICFENSNAAFFCDRVLLVEGDCDVIYLKHIAKKMHATWDFDRRNIAVVKVGGKGSFQRYREFFESFDVEVRIVADLDVISDQFEKLGASKEAVAMRSELLNRIANAAQASAKNEPTKSQATDIVNKRTFRTKYQRCRELCERIAAGQQLSQDELDDFGTLFIDEGKLQQRQAIESESIFREDKERLLAQLRSDKIVVLCRGAIEAYYPDGVTGDDKPSQAIAACNGVRSREDAIALCDEVLDLNGAKRAEFEMICECIFD